MGHKDDACAMFCVVILGIQNFDLSKASGSKMWSLIRSSWVRGETGRANIQWERRPRVISLVLKSLIICDVQTLAGIMR